MGKQERISPIQKDLISRRLKYGGVQEPTAVAEKILSTKNQEAYNATQQIPDVTGTAPVIKAATDIEVESNWDLFKNGFSDSVINFQAGVEQIFNGNNKSEVDEVRKWQQEASSKVSRRTQKLLDEDGINQQQLFFGTGNAIGSAAVTYVPSLIAAATGVGVPAALAFSAASSLPQLYNSTLNSALDKGVPLDSAIGYAWGMSVPLSLVEMLPVGALGKKLGSPVVNEALSISSSRLIPKFLRQTAAEDAIAAAVGGGKSLLNDLSSDVFQATEKAVKDRFISGFGTIVSQAAAEGSEEVVQNYMERFGEYTYDKNFSNGGERGFFGTSLDNIGSAKQLRDALFDGMYGAIAGGGMATPAFLRPVFRQGLYDVLDKHAQQGQLEQGVSKVTDAIERNVGLGRITPEQQQQSLADLKVVEESYRKLGGDIKSPEIRIAMFSGINSKVEQQSQMQAIEQEKATIDQAIADNQADTDIYSVRVAELDSLMAEKTEQLQFTSQWLQDLSAKYYRNDRNAVNAQISGLDQTIDNLANEAKKSPYAKLTNAQNTVDGIANNTELAKNANKEYVTGIKAIAEKYQAQRQEITESAMENTLVDEFDIFDDTDIHVTVNGNKQKTRIVTDGDGNYARVVESEIGTKYAPIPKTPYYDSRIESQFTNKYRVGDIVDKIISGQNLEEADQAIYNDFAETIDGRVEDARDEINRVGKLKGIVDFTGQTSQSIIDKSNLRIAELQSVKDQYAAMDTESMSPEQVQAVQETVELLDADILQMEQDIATAQALPRSTVPDSIYQQQVTEKAIETHNAINYYYEQVRNAISKNKDVEKIHKDNTEYAFDQAGNPTELMTLIQSVAARSVAVENMFRRPTVEKNLKKLQLQVEKAKKKLEAAKKKQQAANQENAQDAAQEVEIAQQEVNQATTKAKEVLVKPAQVMSTAQVEEFVPTPTMANGNIIVSEENITASNEIVDKMGPSIRIDSDAINEIPDEYIGNNGGEAGIQPEGLQEDVRKEEGEVIQLDQDAGSNEEVVGAIDAVEDESTRIAVQQLEALIAAEPGDADGNGDTGSQASDDSQQGYDYLGLSVGDFVYYRNTNAQGGVKTNIFKITKLENGTVNLSPQRKSQSSYIPTEKQNLVTSKPNGLIKLSNDPKIIDAKRKLIESIDANVRDRLRLNITGSNDAIAGIVGSIDEELTAQSIIPLQEKLATTDRIAEVQAIIDTITYTAPAAPALTYMEMESGVKADASGKTAQFLFKGSRLYKIKSITATEDPEVNTVIARIVTGWSQSNASPIVAPNDVTLQVTSSDIVVDTNETVRKQQADLLKQDLLRKKEGTFIYPYDESKQEVVEFIGSVSGIFEGVNVGVLTDQEWSDAKYPESWIGVFNRKTGQVLLKDSKLSKATTVHEMGHVAVEIVKQNLLPLYKRGLELVKGSIYEKRVKEEYPELTNETDILEEALGHAIEDKGAKLGYKPEMKSWLKRVWDRIKQFFGVEESVDLENMTLDKFTTDIASKILSGQKFDSIYGNKLEALKVSDAMPMAKIGYSFQEKVYQAPRNAYSGGKIADIRVDIAGLKNKSLQQIYQDLKSTFDPLMIGSDFHNEMVIGSIKSIKPPKGLLAEYTDANLKSLATEIKAGDVKSDLGVFLVGKNLKGGVVFDSYMDYLNTTHISIVKDGKPAYAYIDKNAEVKAIRDHQESLQNSCNKWQKRLLDFFNGLFMSRFKNMDTVTTQVSGEDGALSGVNDLKYKRNLDGAFFESRSRVKYDALIKRLNELSKARGGEANPLGETVEFSFYNNITGTATPVQSEKLNVGILAEMWMHIRTQRDFHRNKGDVDFLKKTDLFYDPSDKKYGSYGVGKKRGFSFTFNDKQYYALLDESQINVLESMFGSPAGKYKEDADAIWGFFNGGDASQLFDVLDDVYSSKNGERLTRLDGYYYPIRTDSDKKIGGRGAQKIVDDVRSLQQRSGLSGRVRGGDIMDSIQDYIHQSAEYIRNAEIRDSLAAYHDRLHEKLTKSQDKKESDLYKNMFSSIDKIVQDFDNYDRRLREAQPDDQFLGLPFLTYSSLMRNFARSVFGGNIGNPAKQSAGFVAALDLGIIDNKHLLRVFKGVGITTARSYIKLVAPEDGKLFGTFKIGGNLLKFEAQEKWIQKIYDNPYSADLYMRVHDDASNTQGVDLSYKEKRLASDKPSMVRKMREKTVEVFDKYMLAPMKHSDRAVIVGFYVAATYQVEAQINSGVLLDNNGQVVTDINSDAAQKEIARLATEVTYKTNNMYMLNDKTEVQRSTDPLIRAVSLFSSQPQKITNLLMRNFYAAAAAGFKDPKLNKTLRGSISYALLMGAVLSSAITVVTGIIRNGYDEDDDLDYFVDFQYGVARNILGSVPSIRTEALTGILSAIDRKSYTSDVGGNAVFENISTGLEGIAAANDFVYDESLPDRVRDRKEQDAIIKLTDSISKMLGAPNTIVKAAANYVIDQESAKKPVTP